MQESMRDTCQIMSDSMSKYVSDKMADTMSEKKISIYIHYYNIRISVT